MPLVACCSDVGAGGDEQLDHACVTEVRRPRERRPPATESALTDGAWTFHAAQAHPLFVWAATSAPAAMISSTTRKCP
jgi:hypothetical protein